VKNITVTVADEVYRDARIAAAQLGTSVSALVAAYLEQLATSEDRFQRLLAQQNQLLDELRRRGQGISASDRLAREDLYDRARVR